MYVCDAPLDLLLLLLQRDMKRRCEIYHRGRKFDVLWVGMIELE